MPAGTRNPRRDLLVCLALVAATAAVYWPVLGNDFVNYDDPGYVTTNEFVQQGLTWEAVKWAFVTGKQANWHPLTWLSHMLDCELFGLEHPWGHHLTSLLLHALNTVLLFGLMRTLVRGRLWPAALVAAVFALHPLHVQSVAWVAERKDVLSAAFGLGAMLAYVRYARHPGILRYLPVPLLLALGLMAKPMLVTLPFVLLLFDYWPLRRLEPDPGRGLAKRVGWLLLEKLPLLALAAASSVVTYLVQHAGGAVKDTIQYPWSERWANAVVALARYLGKTVWPTDLIVFYPHPVGGWPIGLVLAAGALVLGITLMTVYAARARPYLIAGWLWFVGTLVPVIGLVQVGAQSMADRYMYLPLIGLAMMVAYGLSDLVRAWPRARVPVVAVTLVALIASSAAATWQLGYWRNSVTLFQHELAVLDRWDMKVSNRDLADQYFSLGDGWYELAEAAPGGADRPMIEYAIAALGHALALVSEQPDTHPRLRFEIHHKLGFIFARLGDLQQSLDHQQTR
jgi:hypothetical protein